MNDPVVEINALAMLNTISLKTIFLTWVPNYQEHTKLKTNLKKKKTKKKTVPSFHPEKVMLKTMFEDYSGNKINFCITSVYRIRGIKTIEHV